jgi:hypothetical protein
MTKVAADHSVLPNIPCYLSHRSRTGRLKSTKGRTFEERGTGCIPRLKLVGASGDVPILKHAQPTEPAVVKADPQQSSFVLVMACAYMSIAGFCLIIHACAKVECHRECFFGGFHISGWIPWLCRACTEERARDAPLEYKTPFFAQAEPSWNSRVAVV